jgi:uncharacterized metal-binding protein YceD (DUF177 family)
MATEKIAIKELVRQGKNSLVLDEVYQYDDLPAKGPVQVHAELNLNATGLNVRGAFRAQIEEPCDRCYEPYERTLNVPFEERFVYENLTDNYPSGGEFELHNEDFYEIVDAEGELDIKDLIYQLIVIAMTTDRVCQKGTCTIKV